jgi:hypothetical protein
MTLSEALKLPVGTLVDVRRLSDGRLFRARTASVADFDATMQEFNVAVTLTGDDPITALLSAPLVVRIENVFLANDPPSPAEPYYPRHAR